MHDPHLFKSLLYGAVLVVGYMIGGFSLAAYQAPALVWWLNSLGIFYLAAEGKGAIALSNVWLVLLLLLFTISRPWPAVLPHWIALPAPQLWAITLLALWGISLTLIFLLAFASAFFQTKGWNPWQRMVSLGGLSLMALGLGHLLFQWLTL